MDKIASPEIKKKIQTRARQIPIASIIGFVLAVLGIVICGAAYGSVFQSLGDYFPGYNWGTYRFFLEFLLIVVSIVQILSVVTAFFATKYYSTPTFCGTCVNGCRRCTGNISQTLVVGGAFVVLILTVVLFCFSSLIKAAQYALDNACVNTTNTGNEKDVCIRLQVFGGTNVHCGQEFDDFCAYWSADVAVNSLLAGASFLLLSNFILIACSVANFMRYRHNIVDDVIKEALAEKGHDSAGLREEAKPPEGDHQSGHDDAPSSEYKGTW